MALTDPQVTDLIQIVGTVLSGLVSGGIAIYTTTRVIRTTGEREDKKLRHEASRDHAKVLREKIETILELVYEQGRWQLKAMTALEEWAKAYPADETHPKVPDLDPSMEKAVALQRLYFPALTEPMQKVYDKTGRLMIQRITWS